MPRPPTWLKFGKPMTATRGPGKPLKPFVDCWWIAWGLFHRKPKAPPGH